MDEALDQTKALCGPHGLAVLGGFHPEHNVAGSILMLGPGEGFWPIFSTSPEYGDCKPDPLNRWSERVIGTIAETLGARAAFPFGGPPWHPFIAWAMATGRAHASPVSLLVHAEHGLFVSYRGALLFQNRITLPPPLPRPCDTCAAKPCRSACPVSALAPDGYDVPACKSWLDTEGGADCMSRGCAARRACPVGRGRREDAQSAFHMAAFHERRA